MRLSDHRLVVIGGLHRSGTTALARCLAEHPQVSGFTGTGVKEDEGQHLQTVYPSARAYGGAGRFALAPAAHLTEESPLVSEASAERLFGQWSEHWDMDRPVLVEKSPPNLVMTRFVQALFPDARLLIVVRNPVIVALSTIKWSGGSLAALLENWFRAHELFAADVPRLAHLRVVTYEELVREPARELAEIADFVGLDGAPSTSGIQGHRSQGYERQWQQLARSSVPWRRRTYRRLVDRYEERAHVFGYSLRDLDRCDGFSIAS